LARGPAILKSFPGFPPFFQANAGTVLKLGYNRFLPHPFQLIIHTSLFHSMLYTIQCSQTVFCGGLQAISKEKALQKIYQTLNE
jgi:hypothetical protein